MCPIWFSTVNFGEVLPILDLFISTAFGGLET